jgi:hypothetical protein
LRTISEAVFAPDLTLCFNQAVLTLYLKESGMLAGHELFETLVENTGLPEHYVRVRLSQLLRDRGLTMEELTLDNVRDILSTFLLDLIQQDSVI